MSPPRWDERSRIFWTSLAGGVGIGLALGVAGTVTVLQAMGLVP